VLVFAAMASFPGNTTGDAFYLLIAPLIPVLGVVGAFASDASMIEFTNATPYSKTRLALLRTAAVTVTTVPLVAAMGAILPGIGWIAVAWLGPALGLTLAALVALTWWSSTVTGTAAVLVWTVVVGAAYARHDIAGAVSLEAQTVYLVVACLTAAGLVIRSRFARTPGGYA
jgi:hypothetical protein